ncbi:pre-mRNA-splicing factor prp12-like isoform X1 [Chenopodium quinoa]|uniref:pre-mRNA-splicing factor prp12-like isoform X1 n=1 Tax=Chenopodium quinoa TaxID=63459 RepID=UPI000B7924E2|nr:pre-mRNA-splicing factor prp12-like isoform X1 [Chenopodium quinoa]
MAVTEAESSSSSTPASNSEFQPSNGAHYLAKCVLPSSVILQVVHGHIRSPSSNEIVFGKETSIELVEMSEDGVVQSICEQPVFGVIKDMAILPRTKKLRTHNSQVMGKDMLVIISDSGKLSFLTFCNEMHRFFPVTHVQLSIPGNSRHQIGRMLAVDALGCYIAVSAYEERVALFSVSQSSDVDMIDKRITYPPEPEDDLIDIELQQTSQSILVNSLPVEEISVESAPTPPISYINGTIWSMCFISKHSDQLSKEHNPVLAILVTRKESSLNELLLLGWDVRENTIHILSRFVESGPLACTIAEVHGSPGLAFLFRVGDILLMDLSDACNPFCVQRTDLSTPINPSEEKSCMEDPFKMQDGDDEGFIAARALLELQDYGMDFNKGNDPMSIDADVHSAKSVPMYVSSWSWEPGTNTKPRMIFSVDTGEYFYIEITFGPDGPEVFISHCLFVGLPSIALLWTTGGYLAAIVEMDNGMVLKLADVGEMKDEYLAYVGPIQNIAPILDMSVMDYHDEKQDQMFACCGVAPEGSLRIIRNGASLERLVRTAPIYEGITAIWTVKMRIKDSNHSFLVLSFVEETRVLSVGVSFTDVTESVGFQPDVCTLACGLVVDNVLVQIDQNYVRLCLPTSVAHPDGIPMSSPTCTSWSPDKVGISLGAVGHKMIIVATANPCFLIILGVKLLSLYDYEICEMQHVRLQSELSCISIPQMHSIGRDSGPIPAGFDIGNPFVIGTHKPSVEILSYVHGQGIRVLAAGMISLTNTTGTAISGCIPQDVRLVLVDRLYILSGLRNGMLLRFEWPTTSWESDLPCYRTTLCSKSGLLKASAPAVLGPQLSGVNSYERPKDNDPVHLLLIAIRRIGITPVFLVPLSESLDADVIALSDRPWLVQAARHSLSYISISFEPSTYVTPVCSAECPKGLLFVAENCLHLVEMVHSKRLNVQKFHLGGTPRKVLYHSESRLLLVMRTDLDIDPFSSDICCVDPLSGSVVSTFKFGVGETGKCMEFVQVGNQQVLLVGTSLSSGPAIMPSGEAESTKGRLIMFRLEHFSNSDSGSMTMRLKSSSSMQHISPVCEAAGYTAERMSNSSRCSSPDDNSCDEAKLEDSEAWQLEFLSAITWPGVVLAICPYLDEYFLASSGNAFYVCGFQKDNPKRLKRYAVERTRFMIVSLTAYFTRIAVGDCRDGVLFYDYHETAKKLEQIYCDPGQRLVADCLLTDTSTAFVSDRKGSIAVLTSSTHLEDNASPECNLTVSCSYYTGEIAMSIKKGSFSYKMPAEDGFKGCDGGNSVVDLSRNGIMASTLLGSILIFIPISREEYELLKPVQARLAVHPLTAPILGNNHSEFRSRENKGVVPTMLDGDMLAQFLELTSIQQEAVLGLPCATAEVSSSSRSPHSPVSVDQVVQLLERVHNVLN